MNACGAPYGITYVILPAHMVLSCLQAPLAAAGSCMDQAPARADPPAASQPLLLSNISDSGSNRMWWLTSSSARASHFPLNRHMIHHLLLTVSYVWSNSVQQHWPYGFPNSKSWFQETIPFPNILEMHDRGKCVMRKFQKSRTAISMSHA